MKNILDLQKMRTSGGIIHREWEMPGSDSGSSASSTLFILPNSFGSFVCR